MKIKTNKITDISFIKDFTSIKKLGRLIPHNDSFWGVKESDKFVSEPIVEVANMVKPKLILEDQFIAIEEPGEEFIDNKLLTHACRDKEYNVVQKLLFEAKKLYSTPVLKKTLLKSSWIDANRDINTNYLRLNTIKASNEMHKNKKITNAYESMNVLNLCSQCNGYLSLKRLRVANYLLKNDGACLEHDFMKGCEICSNTQS